MSSKKQKSKSPKPAPEAEAPEAPEVAVGEEAPEQPSGQAEAAGPETQAQEKSGWGAGELEALKAENAELKDKLLRTVAEMENVRRRTERDKLDTAKYAISNFARDVLTIADNIQRTIDHVPAEAADKDPALKSFLEGVQVTERELLNVMERHGISRLDPKGERFDPNRHQAMFEVPNTEVPEGTIVEVVQAGYEIAERVLRPALVGVSKGGAKPVKVETPGEQAAEAPQAANDDSPDAGPPPEDKPAEPGEEGVGGNFDTTA